MAITNITIDKHSPLRKHLKNSSEIQPDELFSISEITVPIPEKARIEPSVNCAGCGEPTMSTKMEDKDGQKVCRGCLI